MPTIVNVACYAQWIWGTLIASTHVYNLLSHATNVYYTRPLSLSSRVIFLTIVATHGPFYNYTRPLFATIMLPTPTIHAYTRTKFATKHGSYATKYRYFATKC